MLHMIRTVYKFDENNIDYIQLNVHDEYELKEKETFDLKGFYIPKWDVLNNEVTENAATEYIEAKQIEYLNMELDYESGNLLTGALRLVLNENGTREELDAKYKYLELTYLWAKGELKETDAYIDVDALNNAALIEINESRDDGKKLDLDSYKFVLVSQGEYTNRLLTTFKEMINKSLEKVKRLMSSGKLTKAIEAMQLIKDVSKDITMQQAQATLTQILAL